MAVNEGLNVDGDVLVEQLVLAIQLGLLTLHRVVHRVQLPVFVVVEAVLFADVVELELSGNSLADNVTQLIHVGNRAWVLVTLVDDNWHNQGLGRRHSLVGKWSLLLFG